MAGAKPDRLTILRALGGALLAKRISRTETKAYDRASLFRVEVVPVAGIIELGKLLARLERDPHACIVRGRPLPNVNRARCRRLLYPQIEDDAEVPATFEPAARRWLALDIDSLEAPEWDPDALARRREAIDRDHELYPDAVRPDLEGDLDPAPIDPARDPFLIVRYTVEQLPAEFADAHAWWQLTASAGIKPGVRLRLWYWLDRPVSDDEARRWLEAAPVDLALYNPIQAHYTAAPVFSPPSLGPVPVRSGFWWRHEPAVAVPELPEPPPPPPVARRPLAAGDNRRARIYAQRILDGIEGAPAGEKHRAMRSAAVRLYGMAAHGLLDPGEVTRELLAIGGALRWPEKRLLDLLAWGRATAESNPQLPEAAAMTVRPINPKAAREKVKAEGTAILWIDAIPDENLRDRLKEAWRKDRTSQVLRNLLECKTNGATPGDNLLALAGAMKSFGRDVSLLGAVALRLYVSDFLVAAPHWPPGEGVAIAELPGIWERAERGEKPEAAPTPAPNGEATAAPEAPPEPMVEASTVEPLSVDWTWYPYIAAGVINILGAKGGSCKGLTCVHLTAAITTGGMWPDGTGPAEIGHVLWCEAEDPVRQVVVPRLIAAGADRSKVTFATRKSFADEKDLRGLIEKKKIRLIVLSPMVSFLKLNDLASELGVREVLEKIQSSVEETPCAILGIAHSNKKADLAAIERILGAVAFTNFVRSVLLTTPDDQEEGTYRLVHAKYNLSRKADDLILRPVHIGDNERDQYVRLSWSHPEDGNANADAVFDRKKASDKPSARQWLVGYLRDKGEVLRDDIIIAGVQAGFTEASLEKAVMRDPRLQSRREHFPNRAWWRFE